MTVTSFVAAERGQTLRISNPQSDAVTGAIIPAQELGSAAISPLPFTLAAGASQEIALDSVLTAKSGIVLVEASNAVRVTSHSALPLAHLNRSTATGIRFVSANPMGDLLLGLFGADVRLSIYASASSSAPLVVRTYSSGGAHRLLRVALRDLLPNGTAFFDGRAVIEPFAGQAVIAAASLVPIKQRAARSGLAVPPPMITVSGPSTLCEFAGGVHVSASSAASYAWDLFNASAQGATTGAGIDMTTATASYATVVLRSVSAGAGSQAEIHLRVAAKPVVSVLDVGSAVVSHPLTIRWDVIGEGSAVLSGTDFPVGGLPVTLDAKSYTYTPASSGAKTVTLAVEGICGSASRSSTYAVVSPPPAITNFSVTPSELDQFAGGYAQVAFTLQDADSWVITTDSKLKGWADAMGTYNYFNDPASSLGSATWTGAGTCSPNTACTARTSGTISLRFTGELPNNDGIVLTATGAGGTTTRSVAVRITGGACAPDGAPPATVPVGGSAMLRVKWISSDAHALVPSSSLGNAITPASMPVPAGYGSYAFTYTRSNAGDDLVKITGFGCSMQFLIK